MDKTDIWILIGKLASFSGLNPNGISNRVEKSGRARINKVTLYNAFNGMSDPKTSTLVSVLDVLGIDIKKIIEDRVKSVVSGVGQRNSELSDALGEAFRSLNINEKRALLGQLISEIDYTKRANTVHVLEKEMDSLR